MPVLCESCYPNWRFCEVKTIIPLSFCVKCGCYDNRRSGGAVCHLIAGFPTADETAYFRRYMETQHAQRNPPPSDQP